MQLEPFHIKLNMIILFHSFCRYLDYSATELQICSITGYCYEYYITHIGIDVSLTKKKKKLGTFAKNIKFKNTLQQITTKKHITPFQNVLYLLI